MAANQSRKSLTSWYKSGAPWVWLNGGAVAICILMVLGLLGMIAVRGLGHFWPTEVLQAEYQTPGQPVKRLIAEIRDQEEVATERLRDAGLTLKTDAEKVIRYQMKVGNRDIYGADFRFAIKDHLSNITYPAEIIVAERLEWGNLYGYLKTVKAQGSVIAEGEAAWAALQPRLERAIELRHQIEDIEKSDIGAINYQKEQLRLKRRGLELDGVTDPEPFQEIVAADKLLDKEYKQLEDGLVALYQDIARDSIVVEEMGGKTLEVPLAKIVDIYRPNAMGLGQKIAFYFKKLGEFVSGDPREANTEGGIFPAIFGTILMVLIMTVIVTPFGVIAAVYLHEYARQNLLTKLVRVAVNNLAGVPSIVFGVFGLGFFVYFLGGSIDELFYREALPSPTFGTPGMIWASLTLALLTLPVVIVSTEEGLSRIPRTLREGSLALGATKAETLWRVVIPMASPGIMTGLILAIARAAGEVAPLMLVGVVKLAPSLALDGNAPFLHLERKFMHLGFHIYDVGFQSPNVEAARPLVYATALLLVVLIVLLNITAVTIRNKLREKYRAMEH